MDKKKKQLTDYLTNETKKMLERVDALETEAEDVPKSLDLKIEEMLYEAEVKQRRKLLGLAGKVAAAVLVLFLVGFASGKIAVNRYVANANEEKGTFTGNVSTPKPTVPPGESTNNPNGENTKPESTLSPSPTPGIVFPKADKNKVTAVYQLDETTQLWLTNESCVSDIPERCLTATNENGLTASVVWDEDTYYGNCRLEIEGAGEPISVYLYDGISPNQVLWAGENAVIVLFNGHNAGTIFSYNLKTEVLKKRLNFGPGLGAWDSEGKLIAADIVTSKEYGFTADAIVSSDGEIYYIIPDGYYCNTDIFVCDDYMAFYIRDDDALIYEFGDPRIDPSYLVVIDLKNNNNVVLKEETAYFWGLKFVHGEIK